MQTKNRVQITCGLQLLVDGKWEMGANGRSYKWILIAKNWNFFRAGIGWSFGLFDVVVSRLRTLIMAKLLE